ncbi:MAG: four helix bundle protein [Patescibacteria group bacterium]|nr:four helix bundle protein [Patescibacteria group bacterium]
MKKEKKVFRLKDITAYQIGTKLSLIVWEEVKKWNILAKKTMGDQWIRSIDSIAGNIAEGFGRYHKKDKNKFYYNARSSTYEAAHWTRLAYKRGLISENTNKKMINMLRILPKEINILIKLTRENLEE